MLQAEDDNEVYYYIMHRMSRGGVSGGQGGDRPSRGKGTGSLSLSLCARATEKQPATDTCRAPLCLRHVSALPYVMRSAATRRGRTGACASGGGGR